MCVRCRSGPRGGGGRGARATAGRRRPPERSQPGGPSKCGTAYSAFLLLLRARDQLRVTPAQNFVPLSRFCGSAPVNFVNRSRLIWTWNDGAMDTAPAAIEVDAERSTCVRPFPKKFAEASVALTPCPAEMPARAPRLIVTSGLAFTP